MKPRTPSASTPRWSPADAIACADRMIRRMQTEEAVSSAADTAFAAGVRALLEAHEALVTRPNYRVGGGGGIFDRYRHPVLTADHVPVFWRYDLDPATNPRLLERLGINAVFNPGAIKHDGQFVMVARVEGADRK